LLPKFHLKEDKTGDKQMKLKMITKLHFAHLYDQKLSQVCPASKEAPDCILETKQTMNTCQAENHGM
jgi:hypothetical protein